MRPSVKELIFSAVVLLIILGANFYFFKLADRNIVFLYHHYGWGPFHPMTSGRYWMLGFILSGLNFPLLVLAKWITNLDLFTVLKIISAPVFVGVVLITTTLGQPHLPLKLSLNVAVALLAGLIIAFSVANDFVLSFRKTIISSITGLGFVPFLLFFRVLELPDKGHFCWPFAAGIVVSSVLGGIIWVIASLWLFKMHKILYTDIIKTTLFTTYLVLPVLHYWLATPKGIPYISTSDNFFADNLLLRTINWILFAAMVFAVHKFINRHLHHTQ
jgi:hypothetical protein